MTKTMNSTSETDTPKATPIEDDSANKEKKNRIIMKKKSFFEVHYSSY